jgi:hypothetical protein
MSFPRGQSSASVGSPGKHRIEVSVPWMRSLPCHFPDCREIGARPARLSRAQSTKEEASKSR